MKAHKTSLRRRLNRGLTLILLSVFVLHWFAADWVIRFVAEKQMMTRLEHDSDSLLDTLKHVHNGTTHFDTSRIPLVYDQAYSGHYFIFDIDGQIYRSTSLQNQELKIRPLEPRQVVHYHLTGPQQQPLLALGRHQEKEGHQIVLTVGEDLTDIYNDIVHIRLAYLSVTLIILIIAVLLQSADVKCTLRPLQDVQGELVKIANGKQQRIETHVPDEIAPLVKEVNRLLVLIERRLQQSRTAIGNLAHALKTPLAVLVRMTENESMQQMPEMNKLLQMQTVTMRERIERELKRARLSGRVQSGSSFSAYSELVALTELLNSIYADKSLAFDIKAPDRSIPFDREDFLEVVGNLADNACKWAKSRVQINVDYRQGNLLIAVADDGPGCAEEDMRTLTQRGVRLDESVQGHGLGLAIVKDIAEFYSGSLELARSPELGGLQVTVRV